MSRTKIQSVAPGTPAHQAGVRPGETLLAIDGHPIVDVLDYKYYAYDPQLAVCLRRPDGSEHTVHIVKPLGGELGLDFETYLMDTRAPTTACSASSTRCRPACARRCISRTMTRV